MTCEGPDDTAGSRFFSTEGQSSRAEIRCDGTMEPVWLAPAVYTIQVTGEAGSNLPLPSTTVGTVFFR